MAGFGHRVVVNATRVGVARAVFFTLVLVCFSVLRAASSVGEHCLHTAGVTGSNPVPPTIFLCFQLDSGFSGGPENPLFSSSTHIARPPT